MNKETRAKISQWIKNKQVQVVEVSTPRQPSQPIEVVEKPTIVAEQRPVLREEVILGNNVDVLKQFPDNTFTAVVTDPPYGLSAQPDMREVLKHWLAGDDYEHTSNGFMGKSWDSFVPGPKTWEQIMRVLKPGGHIFSFSGTRTYDLMVTAMRLAGSEIRDKIDYYCGPENYMAWCYGCLSDDTEIFIDGRWEHYHKAIAGMTTLCYDMDKDELKLDKIQEVFVYEYNDTAYRIQSDYTDQVVSRNHRCIVERGGKKEFRFADELSSDGPTLCVPVVGNVRDMLEAISSQEESKDLFLSVSERVIKKEAKDAQANVGEKGNGGSVLLGMRKETLEAEIVDQGERQKECKTADMLQVLLWGSEGAGMGEARIQRQGVLDKGECRVVQEEDDRIKQSGVEGRSDIFQDSRELRRGQVCSMSTRVSSDGSSRWVCDGASFDCGESDGKESGKNGSGASHQSRSNGQQVGEFDVVSKQSGSQGIRGEGIVTTTLARIEPFHYVGKVWCVRVPTGAFVARRNGKVFITGNSGFPKSLNISKQFEKKGNAENDAKLWKNYGTALKPAHEPIAIFGKGDSQFSPEAPFKYEAKASGKERNAGCEDSFWLVDTNGRTYAIPKENYDRMEAENESRKDEEGFEKHKISQGNIWPTVKPLDLMRYLVKMVKMPGDNLILDPFMGSGTTMVACVLEGCGYVGIDMDDVAVRIAKHRIDYAKKNGENGYK